MRVRTMKAINLKLGIGQLLMTVPTWPAQCLLFVNSRVYSEQ